MLCSLWFVEDEQYLSFCIAWAPRCVFAQVCVIVLTPIMNPPTPRDEPVVSRD